MKLTMQKIWIVTFTSIFSVILWNTEMELQSYWKWIIQIVVLISSISFFIYDCRMGEKPQTTEGKTK